VLHVCSIKWWSVVTVVSLFELLLLIIELIVGGAKYDGAFVKGNDMAGPSARTLCEMGGKVRQTALSLSGQMGIAI